MNTYYVLFQTSLLIVDEAIFDYELKPDKFMSGAIWTPPQLPQQPDESTATNANGDHISIQYDYV